MVIHKTITATTRRVPLGYTTGTRGLTQKQTNKTKNQNNGKKERKSKGLRGWTREIKCKSGRKWKRNLDCEREKEEEEKGRPKGG